MISAKVLKIGAVAGALTAVSAALWPIISYSELYPVLAKSYNISQNDIRLAQNELRESLEDVGRGLNHLRYQNLVEEREKRGWLSFNDQQELCRLAKVLDYHPTPGC